MVIAAALHSGISGRGSACRPPGLRSAGLFPPPATLLDGTAEHTKAQAVAPDARRVPVAEPRTEDVVVEVPAAAPDHPERAQCSTSRIGRRAARILTMPVLHHSNTLPCMSHKPHAFGFLPPTGCVVPPEFLPYHA